ncbi:MAG: transporter substrate-binding domain-containing protein [Deltaproteobacteria bacterium]|nr:transporter substrate-binding domain-containing protein [Deltaproteobacteria bacterium]
MAIRALLAAGVLLMAAGLAYGDDLAEIKERGVLRHLGIPYAGFVTGSGDGLDVEMVRLFAKEIGVEYRFVETDWQHVIEDLCGKKVKPAGDDVEILGEVPVRGDLIASGLTVLSWREKAVSYSVPTFPTQIWLVARADSGMKPIQPAGDPDKDVAAVKALLKGHNVLGMADTCLDPSLYGLKEAGAETRLFTGNLNELVPAIVKGDAESVLQDAADALVALRKWPGEIKVIGPVSPLQQMAYAFPKDSPELRDAFNRFFERCRKDGTYVGLVRKYYPAAFSFFPEFFK